MYKVADASKATDVKLMHYHNTFIHLITLEAEVEQIQVHHVIACKPQPLQSSFQTIHSKVFSAKKVSFASLSLPPSSSSVWKCCQ